MSNYNDFLFVDQEKKFRGFQKLLQPGTQQAIMFIEAAKDMGKTWLINKIQRHCGEPAVNLPVAQIDFRNPREIHEIQDYLGLLRLIRNKLGYPQYFNPLNATINSFTESHLGNKAGRLVTLQRNIETHFNLDELNSLCFDLGITYENLRGETLRLKSIELVTYCQRHGLLPKLIEACAELRAQIDWWLGWESLRDGPEGADVGAATTNEIIADSNALLYVDSEVERRRAERQINDAFFACLAALMADKQQIVLLFDSFEEAPAEAERWLCDEFLVHLRDGRLDDVVCLVSGRKTPDLTDLNVRHLLVETTLDPFTEEYIREYFEQRRKISGLDWRTVIITSGGIPGALAMMADHALATAKEDDDFFNDL